MAPELSAADNYERGIVLRKAGLFREAIVEFEQAAASRVYALKAYAQIGLCHKSKGRYEEAVAAFRKGLQSSPGSTKETVQILYVMGRTLEMLGRIEETLEAYRWIRREDADYRDVAQRIRELSSHRVVTKSSCVAQPTPQPSWLSSALRPWQGLLRLSK
jgi:tetratricopeptide (TPR) repeat protein